jgi:hypothetical protein
MGLIETNWNPSRRELRQFAGIWFPAFIASIGGVISWKAGSVPTWVGVTWAIAGVVSVIGLINPSWIKPVYVVWMAAAFPVGRVMSGVFLRAIFYLAITPLGLLMRLFGRDPMTRTLDRSAASYWKEHAPGGDVPRYFRQF